jgi:hypothetical protein
MAFIFGEKESGVDYTHRPGVYAVIFNSTREGHGLAIGPFLGQAMRYFRSTRKEPFLGDGYFHLAKLKDKVQEPIDTLKRMTVELAEEKLKRSLFMSIKFGPSEKGSTV